MASKNTHGYESCRSQNRDTLEQMVRQHIMYEGTGDAKRFVDAYGREDPRLHSLWNLKLLRHEIRHDIDHGQPAEARRKHLRVARIFESFIGRRYPQTREDWITSQIELCRALRGMLEAFWSDPAGVATVPITRTENSKLTFLACTELWEHLSRCVESCEWTFDVVRLNAQVVDLNPIAVH